MSNLPICFFFTIATLVLRGVIAANIYTFLSKRERIEYRSRTNFLQRWFLIHTAHFVKDKYSKTEKRVICYSDAVHFFCFLHTTALAALLTMYCICLLNDGGIFGKQTLTVAIIAYCALILLAFAFLAICTSYMDRNYHRSRMKRRK